MTDKQENKLRMYFAVSSVCECNAELWQENETFAKAYEKFRSKIPEIQKCKDILAIETIAGETFKSVDRVELEEMAFYVSNNIAAFARESGNNQLYDETHINRANLGKATDEELANTSKSIVNDAFKHLDNLSKFGISTDLMEQFLTLIQSFSTHINKFRNSEDRAKQTREHLKKLFKDVDEILKNNLDSDIEFFKSRYPDFHQQYTSSREIIVSDKKVNFDIASRTNGKMIKAEI